MLLKVQFSFRIDGIARLISQAGSSVPRGLRDQLTDSEDPPLNVTNPQLNFGIV